MKTFWRLSVLAFIATIIFIRLFTETLGVLPRVFNAVDLALAPALIVGVFGYRLLAKGRLKLRGLWGLLTLFGIVWLYSTVLNYTEVLFPAALLFLVGHVQPILFGLAIYNMDMGRKFVKQASWLLILLAMIGVGGGLTQLDLVINVNPDLLSLTFGTNANQTAFFLSLVLSLLLARWYMGVASLLERCLAIVLLPFFFLAGFKSMWVLYPLVVVVSVLVVGAHKVVNLVRSGLVASAFLAAVLIIALFVPLPELEYFTRGFRPLELGKVQVALQLPEIMSHRPWGHIIGVGPGSFTSRAFRTFAALPNRGLATDVTFAFIPPTYMSPLAAQYVVPYISPGQGQLGSSTIHWPFTSYISLPVESGLLGAAAMLGLYAITWLRLMRVARRSPNPRTRAVALGAAMTVLTLLSISLIDNYLEVTRLGLLTWLFVGLAWSAEAVDQSAFQAARLPARQTARVIVPRTQLPQAGYFAADPAE